MPAGARGALIVGLGLGLTASLAACSERKQAGGAAEATSSTSTSTGGAESGSSSTEAEAETTDGSTEETADEATDDSASGGFVPDSPPAEPSCDPLAHDCPEGQKCVFYVPEWAGLRREATKCIEVTGEGRPFDPCTLPTGIGPEISDDCGADSYCLEVYGTADHGFCAPYAMLPEGDYCDHLPGTRYATENGSTFPDACLHYECQPFFPDTCPEDMRCTFYPAYLYGSMMCWRVPEQQELPLGSACDFGECGEGKLCAPADWLPACASERCCTEFCDLALPEPSCATAGTRCEHLPVNNYHNDPNFELLGACVLEGNFE